MRNWLQLLDKLAKIGGELGLSPTSNAGLRLDRFRRKHEMDPKRQRALETIA